MDPTVGTPFIKYFMNVDLVEYDEEDTCTAGYLKEEFAGIPVGTFVTVDIIDKETYKIVYNMNGKGREKEKIIKLSYMVTDV